MEQRPRERGTVQGEHSRDLKRDSFESGLTLDYEWKDLTISRKSCSSQINAALKVTVDLP